jgi:hypothetical protein
VEKAAPPERRLLAKPDRVAQPREVAARAPAARPGRLAAARVVQQLEVAARAPAARRPEAVARRQAVAVQRRVQAV